MKKNTLRSLFALLIALVMAVCLLTGCGAADTEQVEAQEDAETIQVYLWTAALYDTYAPYIQAQLPDVNIEFIVGNNDLDFYKFLQQNGGLPDIITCCRFSLHDAAPLKDSLMNLALTNEAGAVYNTYLNSFKNEDGSVNWLPVCADAHGFVVNRSLFEQYGIPLPTDYESFVSACQAFEKVGIRGFTADYTYDYTCMETLQGLSAAELTTTDGRKWRTAYSDPASTARVGLDDTVWPGAFERMAQFIRDTHLTADDLALNYDDVTGMFRNGEVAMYFGSSAGVKMFQDEGIDTIFLPFFSQNGEKWIMTTPYFQVALNRDLEQDTARRENDNFKIMSGVKSGRTTGAPICVIVPNENTKSGDYDYGIARPSHADYTAFCKYHGYEDYRGGGHFSGRVTAGIVAAASIVKSALESIGINIATHVIECANVQDKPFNDIKNEILTVKSATFPVIDTAQGKKMQEEIEKAKADGDSVGGVTETAIIGLPEGVGEPWFDSVESILSHALFSIGGIKGVEFGNGFEMTKMRGSAANDAFALENGKVVTITNNNGGVNGGITNGMPVIFKCAVKPTPSIYKTQKTINFLKNEETEINIRGRHDPAIIRRICPVIDAVAALAVADLLQQKYGADVMTKGIGK